MVASLPSLLITEPIPEKVINFLEQHANVTVGEKGYYSIEKHLKQDIGNFDALLCMLSTPVTENVLSVATDLKIVANFAVGYNNIDVKAAHKLGIKIANTPDVLTEACGDFAMALLMAVTRQFNVAESYLRAGKFKGWEPLGFLGMELRGKTLGIVGMGRIGLAFAERAQAFGMKIAYHNRSKITDDTAQKVDALYISSLEELAAISDVLSLNCPLTPETHHLIDAPIFELMPKHSILINISRGPVVNEKALAKALQDHQIAGAGIDVFEEEPKVHPDLLSAPNCTLLPHIASATFETREQIGMLAANAIISVLNNKPAHLIPNLIHS